MLNHPAGIQTEVTSKSPLLLTRRATASQLFRPAHASVSPQLQSAVPTLSHSTPVVASIRRTSVLSRLRSAVPPHSRRADAQPFHTPAAPIRHVSTLSSLWVGHSVQNALVLTKKWLRVCFESSG
jgi:hypothetical protein